VKKTEDKFTVTFNVQGHGTAPASLEVQKDGKVTKPTDPSADGWTFGGWFKEAACTNAWDFANDTVSANVTLYAKWTENGGGETTNYGTEEHPLTPTEVLAIMQAECLEDKQATKQRMYVKGEISEVKTKDFGYSDGPCSELMITDGTTTVHVYRVHMTEALNVKIAVGATIHLNGFGKLIIKEEVKDYEFADNGTESCVATQVIEQTGEDAVEGVAFDETLYEVQVGKTKEVHATVSPATAKNKNVTYSLESVSPAGCVTISGSTLTGVAEGTATVKVVTEDGNKSATASVKIVPATNYGSLENPLSIAEAKAIIDKEGTSKETMYVTGVIFANDAFNTEHGDLNIYLGDSSKEFELYNCKLPESFTPAAPAADDPALVGKTVVASGTGKLFSSTYELDRGCKVEKFVDVTPVEIKRFGEVTGLPESVYVGNPIPLNSVNIAVTYADDKPGSVHPTEIKFDNTKPGENVPVTIKYNDHVMEGDFTVNVISKGDAGDVVISKTIKDVASENSWVNETKYTSFTLDDNVTVSVKEGGGNTGKYYESDDTWRLYESESAIAEITANDFTIKSVTVTYKSSDKGVMVVNSENVESGTSVSVNAKSFTFGVTHSSGYKKGKVLVQSIEVIYEGIAPVAVQTVNINQVDQTLHLGGTSPSPEVQLSATVLPEDATSKTVTWSSSNPGVATISSSGLVQAVSAGTTQIRATAGGVTSDPITVTVIQHVESVAIPTSQGVVVGGDSVKLNETVLPQGASTANVVWSIEEVEPAGAISVDPSTGDITATAVGTAKVYVSVDGIKSNACVITSTSSVVHVSSIELNETELNLEVDEQFQLEATVLPENATDKTYSWSVSDSNVLKVENGLVTALAATDPAKTYKVTATANDGGLTAECTVQITEKAAEKGTAENPYAVDELLTAYGTLGENEWSESRVYVAGEVIAISDAPEYTLKGTSGNLAVFKPTSALGEEDVLPCVGDVAVFEGFVERYVYNTTDKIELTGYAKDTVEAHHVFPTIQSVVSRGISEISLDANSSQNATVTFEGTATNASEYSFTVLIAEGYELTAVTVNGNALAGEDGVYSFIVKGNSVIKVTTHEAGQEVPDPWDYTFGAKTWESAGAQTLDGHVWTMSGTGGEYFGYDATKGQQFGSGKNPYTALTLSCSDFSGTIASIDVYTSGASSIVGDVQVSVGGTSFGDAQALSATNTKYTFSLEVGATGEVQISWSQTSSKAIYIKQIVVTFK